jgi:hypothetical protein
MDALLASLGNLLAVFKDPVNVLLLMVNAGQAYFIFVLRKESREDREKFLAYGEHIAEALNNIRNFLAAQTGKVV